MTEHVEPLALIALDDGGQSVVVRLLSPTPQRGYYDAEIVIRSGFVNATVRIGFNADDVVEASEAEASEVFAGNWPSEGRTAYMTFIAEDPYVVEVHDAPSTQISVRVPIDLKAEWLDAARERLAAVRRVRGLSTQVLQDCPIASESLLSAERTSSSLASA